MRVYRFEAAMHFDLASPSVYQGEVKARDAADARVFAQVEIDSMNARQQRSAKKHGIKVPQRWELNSLREVVE